MTGSTDDILMVLKEVKDLLLPISACFEEQYSEIRRQRWNELEALLDPVRRRVYPLLFDRGHRSLRAIAKEAKTNHKRVKRFADTLVREGLITQTEDEPGEVVYRDIFYLAPLLEE